MVAEVVTDISGTTIYVFRIVALLANYDEGILKVSYEWNIL